MDYNGILTISIALTSVALGAFFGALSNKLMSATDSSKWVWAFYLLGLVVLIVPALLSLYYLEDRMSENILGISTSIVAAMLILLFTRRSLDVKNIYDSKDLDPIINKFTEVADKNEIRLFGGDLNFFGEATSQMDENPQYTKLRSLKFKKVNIICETPSDNYTRIRYGKILSEIPNVELGFYNPDKADLRVRGRILKVNGVNKILMFSKIESKKYKALQTDTANAHGALYNNIWDLIWSMATRPSAQDVIQFKELFSGK